MWPCQKTRFRPFDSLALGSLNIYLGRDHIVSFERWDITPCFNHLDVDLLLVVDLQEVFSNNLNIAKVSAGAVGAKQAHIIPPFDRQAISGICADVLFDAAWPLRDSRVVSHANAL